MKDKPEIGQVGVAGVARSLADLISEETILEVARDLSLGLDCNVPLMACREAAEVLFSALERDSWSICPPEPGFRQLGT